MSDIFFTSTNITTTNEFIASLKNVPSFTPVMQKGNVIHTYLDICDFFTVFKDWKETLIWNKQRPINAEKVDQIYQSYRDNIKDMMYFSISPVISVGTVKGKDPKIIDGQHRLSALELWVGPNDVGFMIPFHIADYPDDNLRFKAFVDVNSNTQLPEIYKVISDKDVRQRKLAEECINAIKQLEILKAHTIIPSNVVTAMHIPKFNIEVCKDKIFTCIKSKNSDIKLTGDIESQFASFSSNFRNIIIKYNDELSGLGITSFNKDGLIHPNLCISCENKNSKKQCYHPRKKNDKCLKHAGSQTADCDSAYIREALYERVKLTNSFILMYTDYSWVGDVFDLLDNTAEDIIAGNAHKKKLITLKKKMMI